MLFKYIGFHLCLPFAFGLAFASVSLQAQTILKLATITPDNTPWNNTLYAGVEQIEKLTNGRVRIKIFGNGLAGEEREVLRKIRLGSVDAGVFTALSLKSVVPETLVLSLPYFVRNQKDLYKMLAELTPDFNQSFAKNGYEALGWVFSGWIYMFYKDDIRNPNQVGKVRLGVNPAEPELQAAWQALGFRMNTVSFSDTFISLQNGLLTGFYATPVGALAYQWFTFTPHMLNSRVAPLLGNILVSSKSWRRINPNDQKIIRSEMGKMIKNFSNVAVAQDMKALAVMKKNGLKVHTPNTKEEQAWNDTFRDKGHPQVIGQSNAISNELYERAKQIIQMH